MNKNNLILAPMLGYTDHIFRNIFNKHFPSFNYAIAPYIVSNSKGIYKTSLLDRVKLENNDLLTIPQILSNDADQFMELAKLFIEMGHKEVNWNISCPYPRTVKKRLGSGLLEEPNTIDKILNNIFEKLDIKISIKLRLGLTDEQNIFNLIPILNKYPIENITLHPRTAKQMYNGKVLLDILEKVSKELRHEIIYSGDIKTVHDYNNIREKFPTIKKIMIGRGILVNPFLIEEINGIEYSEAERSKKLRTYHKDLLKTYSEFFSGESHLLTRMKELWFYQADLFEESNKLKKKIKKCKNIDSFESVISDIL